MATPRTVHYSRPNAGTIAGGRLLFGGDASGAGLALGELALGVPLAAAGQAAGAAAAGLGFGLDWISAPSIAAWTSVWALFLTEAGLMTIAVWLAWVWLRQPIGVTTSGPLVLFGRTSLFVYWVHVELAFGVFSYPLHSALPLGWSIPGFAAVTGLMYLAATWWSGRPRRPWIPAEIRAQ